MNSKNKKNISMALTVIGLLLVVALGFAVRKSNTGILFDVYLMEKISKGRSDTGLKVMKVVTQLGSKYLFIGLLLALGYYFIDKMERRKAWLVTASIAGSYVTNAVLKLIFSRTRPLAYMAVEKSGYSFPSGHAMVSMSFYTTITYILLSNISSRTTRVLAYTISSLVILLVGFSRLYLGVHWPTDILAGYIMGFIIFYQAKENIRG